MRVRIQHYSVLKDIDPDTYYTKKGFFDDNIYTFDIETISLFKMGGKWLPFDFTKPPEYYKDVKKACCPYIWQFGVNEKVYFGREFYEFENILKMLADEDITKYIFVHNLSYETNFLLDIIERNNWTITELCARNIRQPIQFKIKELNIVFRCSYMLTNLSLAKSAEKYTNLHKAVGDLDYNLPYSPISPLGKKQLHYCEMDCITLYHIIKWFKNEYGGHVKSIPLTQTGEVRHALRQELDYWYFKKTWKLVPPEHIYLALKGAFQGGITHANIIYANRVLKDVFSYDFASSYLYTLTCFKYPSEPFFLIRAKDIERYSKTHCILYDVTLEDIRATKHNHYLSYSKLSEKDNTDKIVDNGRVVKLKKGRLLCTDYDMKCLSMCYEFKVTYNHVWASFARYLDKRILLFILKKYSDKTTLKGVEGEEDFYMKAKQQANCIFGMSCSDVIRTGIYFDLEKGWGSHELGDIVKDKDGNEVRFIDMKIEEMKHSYSTLFFYAVGVWCTSISRFNLWTNIMATDSENGVNMDKQVAYYDTDSLKGVGNVGNVIENYNKGVIERIKQSSKDNDIDIALYMPKDRKGKEHPLGVFECETPDRKDGTSGRYRFFKTMGAKKYCYMDCDGALHLTVSGVRKSAVRAFKSINDFNNDFVFGYEYSGRLIHYYEDDQEPFTYTDVNGNEYRCTQRHSIILQPSTYKLGQTDEYQALIDEYFGIIPNNQ